MSPATGADSAATTIGQLCPTAAQDCTTQVGALPCLRRAEGSASAVPPAGEAGDTGETDGVCGGSELAARFAAGLNRPRSPRLTGTHAVLERTTRTRWDQGSERRRLAGLRGALASETDPLAVVTEMLRWCRDDHAVLWEYLGEPACQAWRAHGLRHVHDELRGPAELPVIDVATRELIDAALGEVPDRVPGVVAAHVLAQLLDARYAHGFGRAFRRRGPVELAVGDPLPLDDPGLRQVVSVGLTSPPWRLANRLDETRHVRLAGRWAEEFSVTLDYHLTGALSDLADASTVIATCHPNRSVDELILGQRRAGRLFPVGPADEAAQQGLLDALIARVAAAGARVVVLPELCVTGRMAERLQSWVERPDGPSVLVAGSFHHRDQGRGRNTAVTWVRGVAGGRREALPWCPRAGQSRCRGSRL
ncbi:MAG: hypothetical protein IVW52_17915 [Acidimicrobiales bacterium]|nr:hypothetical protein [Acidimicrobiales bacterium]